MNRIYKTLWSVSTQSWQAVPETAKASGKKSASSAVGVVASVALSLSLSGGAHAQSPPASNQLPTGGTIARGTATIQQTATAQAAAMTVNQTSQRAVINWDTFNLGSKASVNFVQPNAQAVTLNRVNDSNPSQIFGRMTANGQVFLSNANGVYFSPTSSVNVGALTATTHSISDDNFMSGKYVFERNGATGKVMNEGNITAALGGYVALLAPEVQNAGVVVAQAGTVALAAGEMITLTIDGAGGLAGMTTTPSTIATLVENKHAVLAPDGQIILSALALDKLQAGVIKNSGSLEANSISHKGGKIYLEGDDITLSSTSKLEAKGATGGGTVLVGGDWQGSGDVRQATQVTMEAGATIDASATDQGDGGKVVLWSDVHNANSVTQVNGRIDAKGAGTGQGGQVETSGHDLKVGDALQVNTGGGQWLLDPYDITIGTSNSNTSGNTVGSLTTYTASASGASVNYTTLQTALSANNVTVSTTSAASDTGNITLNFGSANNKLTWSTANTLTLAADGAIGCTTAYCNFNITGSGTLVMKPQSGTSLYTGVIEGTGNFVKDGAGLLQMGGNTDQKFTGTTRVMNGTLEMASGRSLSGSTALTVDNGATFKYNSTATASGGATHVGSLAGAGTVEAAGVGNVTTVKLDIGSDNTSTTFNGVFKGTAPSFGPYISKSGTGTFTYDGTVSGNFAGFAVGSGTVQVGTGGSGGSVGNVTNVTSWVGTNGTLIINRNDTLIVNQGFSGIGLVKLTGSVNVNSGSSLNTPPNLEIGAGTTLTLIGTSDTYVAYWLGGGAITNNGTISLTFATLGSNVSGAGALVANSGRSVLTGTNSYSGTTTINAGAFLSISQSGAPTTGSLGTGAVVNNGGLTFYRSGTVSVGGDISGSGSLENAGTGTLTLSGNNSYTGGTKLSAGTLALGSSTALGTSGNITLSGGGLQYSASNTTDYSARFIVANNKTVTVDTAGQDIIWASALTATGTSLVKNGTGTLLLSGNNTWDGSSASSRAAVTVNGGTLELSGSSIHLGDTLSSMSGISNDGTLTISSNSAVNVNTRISGTGGLIKSGSGDLTLSMGNSYSGGTRLLGGNLIANGNSGALLPTLGSVGTISFEGGTLKYISTTRDINDYSSRFSTAANQAYKFNISGTRTWASDLTSSGGTLTLDGGTLVLSGNNSYSGATTVNSGTLQLGNGGTTGSVAGDIVLKGTGNAMLKINRSGNFTLSNTISATGGAPGSLDVSLVNDTDVVTLNASNSFERIWLTKGSLGLGSANAIGGMLTGLTSIYFYGGRLQYSAANTTDYSGNSSTWFPTYAYAIDTNGQTVTLASPLSGASTPLKKYGAGTLILGANATYTGATYVYGGTLQVGTGALGGGWATSAAYVASGASLVFKPSSTATISTNVSQDPTSSTSGSVSFVQAASGDTTTYSGNLANAVALVEAGPGKLLLTGSASSTGTTTINAGGTLQVGNATATGVLNTGDITNNGTLIYNRTDAKTIAAKISGTGNLVKQGALALTLTGANDYTGNTTLTAGTLALGSASALGTGGTISFGGGTLQFASGFTTDYSGRFSTAASQAYSLDTNGQSVTLGSALSSSGGTLTKLGAGTLTLAVANSYTGATTVSAGTLALTNAAGLGTTAAGTTVANGATLDLQGVMVGNEAITLNGGTLATSTGTSSLGGTVAMGASSTVDVGGTSLTLSGIVSGAYALTKSGTGNLVLAAANTYNSTTLSAGTLRLAHNTALGGSGITVPAGTTLELGAMDGSNLSVTGKTITLASSSTYEGGGYLHNVAGANTWSGAITLQNNSTVTVDTGTSLNLTSASSTAASGAIVSLKPSNGNLNFGTVTGSGGAGYFSSGTGGLTGTFVGFTAKTLVYLRPIDASNLNSSYYGSAPGLTLGFFSASSGGTQYNLVSGTDYTGTIVYSGAPTATSVPGSYSISYTSGATISNAAYYLAGTGASLTWTVNAKPLTITVASSSKTYDGQAFSGGSVTYSAFANGQSASALTGSLTYGGTAQGAVNASSTPYTITASGLTSSNYAITYVDGSLTINKANLSKVTAAKTYDGLSTVTAAQMTAIEGVNGETFTASAGTASISDKNVTGTKTLTDLSALTLGSTNGGLTSNYNLGTGLPAAGSANQVDISALALQVSGVSALNKTFDGSNSATLSGTAQVASLAGDAVTLDASGVTAQFGSSAVGHAIPVTVTGYALAGAAADNYSLSQPTGLSADILAAAPTNVAPVIPPIVLHPAPLTPPSVPPGTSPISKDVTPPASQAPVQVVLVKPASVQAEGLVNVRVSAEVVSSASNLVIPLADHLDWPQLQANEVVSVRLVNGMNLPDWVQFVAPQKALVAKAIPPNALPLQVMVQIGDRRYVVDIREADLNKVGVQ